MPTHSGDGAKQNELCPIENAWAQEKGIKTPNWSVTSAPTQLVHSSAIGETDSSHRRAVADEDESSGEEEEKEVNVVQAYAEDLCTQTDTSRHTDTQTEG
ncbi:unnamed protein product [Boreogadus saida]